ncbi:MAG TPA: Na+/H+ antiporter [Devosiaceae bacterium]|nr:Na+/H+ antiporter [Devosiaceae bacterium]
MDVFDWIIVLLLGATLLAALARRLAIPYPTLLAIGGVALAFVPQSPGWTLDPHLALTLFVAPVLLDAAYDSSPRDLKENWRAVASLAIMAVGVTTVAVAIVIRLLVPDIPWPVAVALGAIVAPPDAAAATAVVRQIKLPHRILTILEGESLVNDASALLLYRLAVFAAVSGGVSFATIVPTFFLVVLGSIAAGWLLSRVVQLIIGRIQDVPTAIIVQFCSTFGVWIAAESIGLSGILTIVTFAILLARQGRLEQAARMRVPTNAVWATAVFVLNIFAFVLIGMQLRPIWERLDALQRQSYPLIALAVLLTAIAVRFAWVMSYSAFQTWRGPARRGRAFSGGKPTLRGSVVISWAGMRGIVTLAAAFALPEHLRDGSPFPYRDLILLCAFAVVFGTLVVQGLTLKPLIRVIRLRGEDTVGAEVRWARREAYRAALEALDGDKSEEAERLRREYNAAIELDDGDGEAVGIEDLPGNAVRRTAIAAARKRANDLRLKGEIGDEAYRTLEAHFDWTELSAGGERV